MNPQLDKQRTTDGTTGEGDSILSVRNLRKTYGSGEQEVEVVDGVSFDIASGSIVGLLGHNGAGKTTIIKMVLGLITPTGGTAFIDGTNVQKDRKKIADSIAAVLEGARNIYWRLTIRENLNFFARLAGVSPDEQAERHERLLQQLDLLDRADAEVNELSRGMKQKVSLAAMLARQPDLLILDEPTMGLDVESSLALRREISRIVDDEDMTVIISSHNMDVIENLCDRVIILNNGSMAVDDSIDALRSVFESHDLELTFDGTIPESFREDIEADYYIESCEVKNGRTQLRLRIERIEETRHVLSRVFEADLQLLDVQTTQIDMEDIYLEVTQSNDDRDAGDVTDEEETYA